MVESSDFYIPLADTVTNTIDPCINEDAFKVIVTEKQSWIKCIPYGYLTLSNALLTSFLFGYSITALNTSSSNIAISFRWCNSVLDSTCSSSTLNYAIANASLFLGAVLGCIIQKYLVHNKPYGGRRYALQLACVLFFIGAVIGCISKDVLQLFIARIITGTGVGIVAIVTPLYLFEMSTPQHRSRVIKIHRMVTSLGLITAVILGLVFTPLNKTSPNSILLLFNDFWWRVLLGIQGIPAILALFGFYFVCYDETPHYLIESGRTTEAVNTIMSIHNATSIFEIEEGIVEIAQNVAEYEITTSKNTELLTLLLYHKEQRYLVLLGFSLAVLQQFTGIVLLISSSNMIFNMAGIESIRSATWISTTYIIAYICLTKFIAPLIFVTSVSKKRQQLIVFLFGMGAQFLILITVATIRYLTPWRVSLSSISFSTLAGIFGLTLVFALTVGRTSLFYDNFSDIYPKEVKDTAMLIATILQWTTACCIVFTGILVNNLTQLFFFLSILTFLGLILTVSLWITLLKYKNVHMRTFPSRSLIYSTFSMPRILMREDPFSITFPYTLQDNRMILERRDIILNHLRYDLMDTLKLENHYDVTPPTVTTTDFYTMSLNHVDSQNFLRSMSAAESYTSEDDYDYLEETECIHVLRSQR